MGKNRRRSEVEDLQPGSHRERDRRAKNIDLEEENRALKVRLRVADPLGGLSQENSDLVDRLIRTLLALQDAGDPRTSSPLSGQTRYRRPSSEKDEGSPTRWARALEYRIHRALKSKLNEYDLRVEGRYEPPPRDERAKCVTPGCENEGVPLPKFVGPKRDIELVHCPKCLGELELVA